MNQKCRASLLTVNRKLKSWFNFYRTKRYRSVLLEALLQKIISKFWEYSKKNIHYEERLNQSYICIVTEASWKVSKKLIKLISSTRNTSEGVVMQIRLWWRCYFFFLIIVTRLQLHRNCQGQIASRQVDCTVLLCNNYPTL